MRRDVCVCFALIMSPGDHLYRMDYRDFVRKHRESGAAITIAALPCDEKRASAFGLMKIDESGKVRGKGGSDEKTRGMAHEGHKKRGKQCMDGPVLCSFVLRHSARRCG